MTTTIENSHDQFVILDHCRFDMLSGWSSYIGPVIKQGDSSEIHKEKDTELTLEN